MAYVQRGLSLIPLQPRGKEPLVCWTLFQRQAAPFKQVELWAKRWTNCNWGIVTGAVSGVVVLDLDSPEAVQEAKRRGLPRAPLVSTGKGYHVYFAHPGHTVPNVVRVLPGADVRGDGGYVVAPPSIHPSGRLYQWVRRRSIWESELPPFPHWLQELLELPQALQGEIDRPRDKRMLEIERIALGVEEGERNNAAASMAGYLLRHLPSARVALALLEAWNLTNKPPLVWDELHRTFDSIARREAKREASL
ncbi:bifunctional DNA primase/polymerase [Alicyclobacillus herbarius]|uniref:bifunctional DNA primase/polymerase n=1 Tax=Alicyclobacillus herbarius TaxID=122960 RepID=UPI00041BF083|nr:bifunctional DNA primase/polymerase [Alicyclobacillus herbarius]